MSGFVPPLQFCPTPWRQDGHCWPSQSAACCQFAGTLCKNAALGVMVAFARVHMLEVLHACGSSALYSFVFYFPHSFCLLVILSLSISHLRNSIPRTCKTFSRLLQSAQTGSGAHPACCSGRTVRPFPGGKAAGAWPKFNHIDHVPKWRMIGAIPLPSLHPGANLGLGRLGSCLGR